ncbi:hypothetical protein P3S67_016200 [Capsicum chacoense]
MKYVIDEIPQHPSRFDSSCNAKFLEEFEEILSKEVIEMFSEICFDELLKKKIAATKNRENRRKMILQI